MEDNRKKQEISAFLISEYSCSCCLVFSTSVKAEPGIGEHDSIRTFPSFDVYIWIHKPAAVCRCAEQISAIPV